MRLNSSGLGIPPGPAVPGPPGSACIPCWAAPARPIGPPGRPAIPGGPPGPPPIAPGGCAPPPPWIACCVDCFTFMTMTCWSIVRNRTSASGATIMDPSSPSIPCSPWVIDGGPCCWGGTYLPPPTRYPPRLPIRAPIRPRPRCVKRFCSWLLAPIAGPIGRIRDVVCAEDGLVIARATFPRFDPPMAPPILPVRGAPLVCDRG